MGRGSGQGRAAKGKKSQHVVHGSVEVGGSSAEEETTGFTRAADRRRARNIASQSRGRPGHMRNPNNLVPNPKATTRPGRRTSR